jgi:hypothetical protein
MCNAYESNPCFNIKRFVEDGQLKGFCMFQNIDGVRILSEAHYIGHDKTVALKMWKFMFKGATKFRASVCKENSRMIEFLKKIKFNITSESPTSLIMERTK